jgi:polysaccharide biosynthesis/export protein
MLLALLPLAGCGAPKLVDTGAVGIRTSDTLPPPTTADLVAGERPHYIGPFDRISVDVLGLPELSRDLRVDAAGHVAVPLAGSVSVIGKSPEELAQDIEARLRDTYVRDPSVTVAVLETVSQTVTIDGEVRVPGIYPVLGQMTLMRAIASAQGTSDFALTSHVLVFRTVEGRQMAALYDLRAIRAGAYEDPGIYTNDIVVVSESRARRLFPQLAQMAGVLVAPLVTILDNNN